MFNLKYLLFIIKILCFVCGVTILYLSKIFRAFNINKVIFPNFKIPSIYK